MRTCPFLGAALLVALAAAPRAADVPSAARAGSGLPGEDLPVVMTHRYRMSGHIRPLLAFWISRDDVGDGRLVWRRGAGAQGWDFVLGTDPARAPRGLNRWGYIAEEEEGRSGQLLAVMSKSKEDTLGEVRAGDDREAVAGLFEAIRATVAPGESRARISNVATPTALTIHDVDALVERVRVGLEDATFKVTPIGPDVRPGFLAAVAELVDGSVAAWQRGRPPAPGRPGAPVPYVFGEKRCTVTLTSSRRLAEFNDGDRTWRNVVHGKFDILTLATGDHTRFELVYGLDGDLAGVPVQIVYSPKWWLKVVLHLQD